MARLQRPPSLKEIVMRSLLDWRTPADTLVDDDDGRTTEVPCAPWDEPAPSPRDTLVSVVFDLSTPARAHAKSSP
ncbi:MAG: hypothetical protein ACRELB_18320 [Polyangiaceae bacterium]